MDLRYILLPILAGIMFGGAGVFVRTLTENGIDSITLLFLRFSIAIAIMLIVIIISDISLLKIEKQDMLYIIPSGLCILALNLFYNYSINTLPLSLAAVLLSTAPVFVLIIAYFVFDEKITLIKVASVILVLIGCTFATGLLEENLFSISLLGLICGIAAGIFWALYSISSRKALDIGNHTFTILFYALIIMTIVSLPFADFNQISNYVSYSPIINSFFLILHSLFSFALPYVFITIALNHIDTGTVVILSSGEPIAALIFGIIVYHEIPSFLMICGVFITIIALLILTNSLERSDS